MRATWPRWLVPYWSSKPSTVSRYRGGVITPALLTSRSTGPSTLSANRRTDSSEARSSSATLGAAVDPRRGLAAGVGVAAGEHDGRPVGGQVLRGVEADAGVGAGHDRRRAGQVGEVLLGPAHRVRLAREESSRSTGIAEVRTSVTGGR